MPHTLKFKSIRNTAVLATLIHNASLETLRAREAEELTKAHPPIPCTYDQADVIDWEGLDRDPESFEYLYGDSPFRQLRDAFITFGSPGRKILDAIRASEQEANERVAA